MADVIVPGDDLLLRATLCHTMHFWKAFLVWLVLGIFKSPRIPPLSDMHV